MKTFNDFCKNKKSSADISISEARNNTKSKMVFTFRNHAFEITSKYERADFSMNDSKTKLYFHFSQETGWKMQKGCSSNCVQIGTSEIVKAVRPFIGDHEMFFDPSNNVYYIEKENKKSACEQNNANENPEKEKTVDVSEILKVLKEINENIKLLSDHSYLKNAIREGFEEVGK